MRNQYKITPAGTRDLLFEECARDSRVGAILKKLYEVSGYRRVMTPMLEFYDVFDRAGDSLPLEEMFPMTDSKGRLLVLSPDCTIPIARLVASRLKGANLPLRLYYSHSIFRRNPDAKGKRTELHQVGIELIGNGSFRSDCEVLGLAARSLEELSNGTRYRLEICHIGYFKALVDALQTDEETAEEIRAAVETKNFSALTEILADYPNHPAANALRKLPSLFGGPEVLEEAEKLFNNEQAKESLDSCRKALDYLQALGLGDRAILDLGLVNQAEYYTGIIFRGYYDGVGEPVLSGGRYDKLLEHFGDSLESIGFAVDCELAGRVGETPLMELPKTAVYAETEADFAAAAKLLEKLQKDGVKAVLCLDEGLDEAKEYVRKEGISTLLLVSAEAPEGKEAAL